MPRCRRMLARALLCASVALAALGPNAALAAVSPVIQDCVRHLRLTHHYTATQLEQALKTMPADVAQYFDCPDVIRAQLLAQVGAKRSSARIQGGSGGSGFPVWAIALIAVVAAAGMGTTLAAERSRRSRARS